MDRVLREKSLIQPREVLRATAPVLDPANPKEPRGDRNHRDTREHDEDHEEDDD